MIGEADSTWKSDPQNLNDTETNPYLMTAARNMGAVDWAIQDLRVLINREPPNYDDVSQEILENLRWLFSRWPDL